MSKCKADSAGKLWTEKEGLEHMKIELTVNNKQVILDTDPGRRLLDVLREDLALTGAKDGCGEGMCGTCTVLMDDRAVRSCKVTIGQTVGHAITTIEGLSQNGEMDPVQEAFVRNGAIHCGYCTPGMILTAKALLLKNPHPSEGEVRKAIAGNICRCSDYTEIIAAVLDAAK